jgi:hypothetical protein
MILCVHVKTCKTCYLFFVGGAREVGFIAFLVIGQSKWPNEKKKTSNFVLFWDA